MNGGAGGRVSAQPESPDDVPGLGILMEAWNGLYF